VTLPWNESLLKTRPCAPFPTAVARAEHHADFLGVAGRNLQPRVLQREPRRRDGETADFVQAGKSIRRSTARPERPDLPHATGFLPVQTESVPSGVMPTAWWRS